MNVRPPRDTPEPAPEAFEGQCKARSKTTGQRCRRYAIPGKDVCKNHGGHSLGGLASPSLKTGRYSKYLTKTLLKDYRAAVNDEDLLSLRSDVELADLRLRTLLPRLEGGDGRTLRQRITETWTAIKDSLRVGDLLGAQVKGQEMDALLASAVETEEVWEEISLAQRHKAGLARLEWKRLVDLKQMISAERAMVLITSIMDVVLRVTPEPDRRLRISNDIFALIAKDRKPGEKPGDNGADSSPIPPTATA